MEVYAEGAELSSGYVVSSTVSSTKDMLIWEGRGLALSSIYNLQDTRIGP